VWQAVRTEPDFVHGDAARGGQGAQVRGAAGCGQRGGVGGVHDRGGQTGRFDRQRGVAEAGLRVKAMAPYTLSSLHVAVYETAVPALATGMCPATQLLLMVTFV
jgi:hypothetical protein